MTLNLRFLYLLPTLALLFINRALNAFFFGKDGEAGLDKPLDYLLTALSLLAAVCYYRYLEPTMRVWFVVVMACVGGLMLESYAGWHSLAIYPNVFTKLTEMLPLFGLYAFYRRYPAPVFGQLVAVVLPTLLLSLVLIYPESLSLSSFMETERGFSVSAAYLLLPMALLCLNWYLTSNNLLYGIIFLLCVALIVFLQHRTVWVCTAVAVVINLLLLVLRVPQAKAWASRLAVLGALGLGAGLVGGAAVVLDNPEVVQKLLKSIEDIEHPTTQGTGTFRMDQYRAYMPYVRERPLGGWRLQGYEVPVLTFNPYSHEPLWPDYTGHHFHSFYLDRLFYSGWLGVLLVLLVPVVVLGRRLSQRTPIAPETAALLAFTCTFLLFGLSYDWPNYIYGFLGILLALTSEPVRVPARLPAPTRRPARRAKNLILAPALQP